MNKYVIYTKDYKREKGVDYIPIYDNVYIIEFTKHKGLRLPQPFVWYFSRFYAIDGEKWSLLWAK